MSDFCLKIICDFQQNFWKVNRLFSSELKVISCCRPKRENVRALPVPEEGKIPFSRCRLEEYTRKRFMTLALEKVEFDQQLLVRESVSVTSCGRQGIKGF